MACRIVLSGASSVGKTTLAIDWKERHREYSHISEVARDVINQHSLTREDLLTSLKTPEKATFLRLQKLIFEEQDRRETSLKDKPFISDRGPDPLAYVSLKKSPVAADELAQTPAATNCLDRYRKCLVLVLCPLATQSDDGFRMVQDRDEQEQFTRILCEQLQKHRIPYVYVDETDRSERISFLERAVQEMSSLEITRLETSGLENLQHVKASVRSISIDQEISTTSMKHFEQTNRMLDRYGSNSFIVFDFAKKVEAARVRRILRGGITINGEEYHFIGCSSSGLKERTCYMFKGSLTNVDHVLEECGSFSSIKSRYKRLKRVGLLFSSATPTCIEVPDDRVVKVPDIETAGGNFTDGCGAVNQALAERLQESCRLIDNDYCPSVFQIRYQGCKGVVMVDPKLKESEQLVIRPSMKKFSPGKRPFQKLWLCDHSRPYTFGHLNRQFITLLSSLGVEDEAFLCIQMEHFERLQNIQLSSEAAVEMLMIDNQPELASLCTSLESLKKYSSQLSKLKTKFISKLEKLRLPVMKSRNVFGVCDPTAMLQYGQCYFRYTEHGKSKILQGNVVVAKNPCYLLGDVRVLTAVNVEEMNYLVDCIVFPTQGERPHPSEIAGSDLDGDQYFVCWDEGLIVPCVAEPYSYPSEDAHETSEKVTTEILIDYFASQRNNMGKIDSYYKYWANKEGAGSPKCQTLGQLFSRSVDATKTGDVVPIPQHLKPPLVEDNSTSQENGSADTRVHVWEKMEKRAKEMKQALTEHIIQEENASTMSEEFIWSLLENRLPNLSEFQLLQLIQNWCSHHSSSEDECCQKLLEFARHISFGEFTIDQQVVAIDCGIPLKTVTNALNTSKLLPRTLLEKFLLDDPHRSWRFYFNSSSTEFNWKHLLRGLQSHPESMIIIKLRDEVTFVLHFLSPPQIGETDLNSGAVVAYFSSKHFNLDLQCVLGSNFKLILNEETLQLFHGEENATFIKFCSEQPMRQQGRQRLESNTRQSQECDTLFDRISVDLTRFKRNVLQTDGHPRVKKQSFLSIEMFVKSRNFQPAYMDITEADLQDDYPIEEASIADDIEDLPSELEEDYENDTPTNISEQLPCFTDAALALLTQSAQRGCCHSFQKILESLLSNNGSDVLNLLPPLHQVLATMINKYCHRPLTDDAVHCLQIIITSLCPYVRTPMDLLKLFSHAGQLDLSFLVDQIINHILPNIQATQSSEYIDVISKWKLWYYLPSNMAVRLSQHFCTLYSSLCYKTLCTSKQDIDITSSPKSELVHLANNVHHTGTLEQHQIDAYVNHFSHLVLNHLLCEIFASKEIGRQTCDTSSSLVRMSCCEYKYPQSPPQEADTNNHTKDANFYRVVFNRPAKVIASKNFTIGSYVAISLMKKQGSPCTVVFIPVAIGHIINVSRHPANIVTEIVEPVPVCLKRSACCERGHWQLVLVGNITSFDRSLKALKNLRETPTCTGLLPLIVHSHFAMSSTDKQKNVKSETTSQASIVANSTTTVEQSTIQPDTPLNLSQQKAVCASLEQRLTLIHGPPGTGKTHVACEIVQQRLIRDSEHNPILVVAETNLAVDNLCEKLMNLGLQVIRIGKLDNIAPPVQSISLEGQIEKKRVEEGKDKAKSPFPSKKIVKSILGAAQVVAATCTSAGDPNLKGTKFPLVIVDEATQVVEPISLIPLIYGCQQLVLIGDPEQLAPYLPALQQKSLDSDLPIAELSVTLFHRLQRVLPSIFLSEQHRMHPELARFPSCKFYGERLLTATSRCQKKSAFQEEIPVFECTKPLVFVRVSEVENRICTSFCNVGEAKVVVKIINYLIDRKVSLQQMVVLTPYSGQVKCIQEECQKEKIFHIRVYTIDSFQGREADVIIFSTVRCNPQGELGFTSDRYRMNVLLTRAKHGLIGIGSENTLSKGSPLWKEWLESVKVIGNVPKIAASRDGGWSKSDFHDNRVGGGARDGRGHWNTRACSKQISRCEQYHASGRSTSTERTQRQGRTESAQGHDGHTRRGGYGYGRRGQRRGGRDRVASSYHHRVGENLPETGTQHWSNNEASPRGRQGNRGRWRGRGGGPSNYGPRGQRYHQRWYQQLV